ncbi:MAG: SprT family zinc-dependent metalloprotease [Ignavibacteriaceae bacterium]
MSSKQMQIADVGSIQFIKSRRAKHISITIKPFKEVRVSVPMRVSFAEAEYVVKNKIDWIQKHQKKIKRVEENRTIFDESTNFYTKKHNLIIRKTDGKKITARISDGEIKVFYPEYLEVIHISVQLFIRKVIEEALRIEAKQYIPSRVNELAAKYNFNYNNVYIKNIRSRWGSCSKKGNVNFSLHLMQLPEELIDYVILHELVHTVEHNHSKNFWAVLDKIYCNSKTIDRKLKDYRIGIW